MRRNVTHTVSLKMKLDGRALEALLVDFLGYNRSIH